VTRGQLQVAAPFWLDRPDEEAVEIAIQAEQAGFDAMWVGETGAFDPFALATAIGVRAPGLRLKVGPVAAGVRSPVALALGVSTVATLTGASVDLALGASSPEMVTGWHDRPWEHAAPRMSETVDAVRQILAGDRADFSGRYVRTRGFRLRSPQPQAAITIAAFGPSMTRVAVDKADEVVLNLVSPEQVARLRSLIDDKARDQRRNRPKLAVWVAAALDPGPATLRQLASQIAVYLRPPGYGEMFTALGFGDLVDRARQGVRRAELIDAIPREVMQAVCAIGTHSEVSSRLDAYRAAGADHVAIVPTTAEDPAGRGLLAALGSGAVLDHAA
jgi:probable F420-dependent oxidoreductase